MEKEYIRVNRETYDALAKEYEERFYAVDEVFYENELFKDLNFEKGKKILEIGPGRGDKLKIFSKYGLDITVVELSEKMCKLCEKRAPYAHIINENILDCDFDFEFDYIYINAVIHNFPIDDAKELVKLMKKWIKDSGIILCTTTVNDEDNQGYEEKKDYQTKKKRYRHKYTKESFDDLFLDSGFNIINKKYKDEIDDIRHKKWQILYLKK